jgi:hypothetical protein
MKTNKWLLMICFGQLCLPWVHSNAATITLNAIDSGSYRSDGLHNASSYGYLAGRCADTVCTVPGTFRDFFLFDLTPLAQIQNVEITDAILTLTNPTGVPPRFITSAGYSSPNIADEKDVFEIFDVTSDLGKVQAGHAAGNADGRAIYADLGTGDSFGSYILTRSLNKPGENSVVLVFKDKGIKALNAALDPFGDSQFAVGGAFQDLQRGAANQYIFFRSDNSNARTLSIEYRVDAPGEVPEPVTMGLAGLGLVLMSLLRRRVAQCGFGEQAGRPISRESA